MVRILRIAGSLAIVLVVYGTYAVVAVPMIEPSADVPEGEEITEENRAAGSRLVDGRLGPWKELFAAGAWELDSPKIVESDRITMLMQDYRNLGDGRVEIRPCTIIFSGEDSWYNAAGRRGQVVVLEAPEGALLRFDGPLDLRRVKIGRLKSGKLNGPIKIRSNGKRPGPEDDLLILTRDVELTEHHVWTPHPVDFRLGPNHGRGTRLHMELLDAEKAKQAQRTGPGIAGIKLFELAHVERLHLELGKASSALTGRDKAQGDKAKGGNAAEDNAGGKRSGPAKGPFDGIDELPVEITCRGPFRFDNVKKVATFEDQVNLWRVNPTGPSDQLSCELLSVFFIERPAAVPGGQRGGRRGGGRSAAARPGGPRPGSTDLIAGRIEARGNPVVVSAPSEKQPVYARGQRLEYDLQNQRIVLDGSREVMLRQGPNEIHARSLDYRPAGPGRLGRILAAGPGWLRGRTAERAGQPLEAWWNGQLQVRPHQSSQLISLTGTAGLKFHGIGRLEAGEIHFWLLELPAAVPAAGTAQRFRLQPDRMLAREDVRLDSPRLSSAVDQLEVWFELLAEGPAVGPRMTGENRRAAASSRLPRPRAGLVPTAFRQPYAGSPLPEQAVTEQAVTEQAVTQQGVTQQGDGTSYYPQPVQTPTPPSPPEGLVPLSPKRQRHFRIAGRLMQARVLIKEKQQTELSELMVQHDVRFVEAQTAEPGERPLLVTGDRLHVADADTPQTAVTVVGGPARFEGRGLVMTGPNINLNRGTNRLWIDGPGAMDVPMDRDLQGRPLPRPGVLKIHWQQRMLFDGRTARFQESVTAAAENRRLKTETLEVRFREPVRFDQTKLRKNPDVEKIFCRGNVLMENRGFQGQRQTSHELMQVVDLAIDRTSGALTAGGPGWLRSVRFGSDDLLTGPAGSQTRPDAAIADPGQDTLRGLYVRFHGSISGNLHQRVMTFHDRVGTAYAPVDSWEAKLDVDDPDALQPGGVVMHCDRLTVNEMATPTSSHRELQAVGNVAAEGTRDGGSFNARAVRMSYAEAKNLLVLEGDGRTDAELFRQQWTGGPTSKVAARKIFYWPQSGQVGRLSVEDARWLESSWFSAGNAGAKPAARQRK